MNKMNDASSDPIELPAGLHGLGLSLQQFDLVRDYVHARIHCGWILRTMAMMWPAVASLHVLVAGVVSDESVPFTPMLGRIVTYAVWFEVALAIAVGGMSLFVLNRLVRMDASLRADFGLSQRASAKICRIARVGTWRELVGARGALLVVHWLAPAAE